MGEIIFFGRQVRGDELVEVNMTRQHRDGKYREAIGNKELNLIPVDSIDITYVNDPVFGHRYKREELRKEITRRQCIGSNIDFCEEVDDKGRFRESIFQGCQI